MPTRSRRRTRQAKTRKKRRPLRPSPAHETRHPFFPYSYSPLAPTGSALGQEEAKGRHWFFAADPTRYHWDTLFVKGKELWHGIKNPAAQRYLKQARKGDHVVCYHGPPARSVYALASVASDPYPDPMDHARKLLAVDLKSAQLLPRTVSMKELKQNRALRRMKFLAQPRVTVSPLTAQEYKEILLMAGLSPAYPFH